MSFVRPTVAVEMIKSMGLMKKAGAADCSHPPANGVASVLLWIEGLRPLIVRLDMVVCAWVAAVWENGSRVFAGSPVTLQTDHFPARRRR